MFRWPTYLMLATLAPVLGCMPRRLFGQDNVIPVSTILTRPADFSGKLVVLRGAVTDVQSSPAFTFYLLDDGSCAVKVRTARRGRSEGEERTVRGRIRQGALMQTIYLVEEDVSLTGTQGTASPAPLHGGDRTPQVSTVSPASPPPNQFPSQQFPPPTQIPRRPSAPALPSSSTGGVYGLLFGTAPDQAREIITTQVGLLAAGTAHPTSSFLSNSVVTQEMSIGGPRVRFRTRYDNLLLGEKEMVSELIFDSQGQVADINFVSDSSPLTDVNLLNHLKDILKQFLQDQLRQLQSSLNK